MAEVDRGRRGRVLDSLELASDAARRLRPHRRHRRRGATSPAWCGSCANSNCAPGCARCRPFAIGRRRRSDAAAQRVWLKQLEQLLATQTVSHGGPIAWVEGAIPGVDAAPAPASPAEISAIDTGALAASREAHRVGARRIIWRNVEDALYPAGWAPEGAPFLRKGAVGLSGDERAATAALRREGALLRELGAAAAAAAAGSDAEARGRQAPRQHHRIRADLRRRIGRQSSPIAAREAFATTCESTSRRPNARS